MSGNPCDTVSTPGSRIRPTVRAVVVTTNAEVLLVRFEFPAGTRWALPGGGIDPGETPLEALRRELDEEVGLSDVDIGPHIWTREHRIPFINGLWDGQREQIHLVRVERTFEPRPRLSWEDLRAEYLHEIRWWHIDEIARADDVVFVPATLHAHLSTLLELGPPMTAIPVEV